MTKNNISQLDTVAANNSTYDDIDISGTTGKVKDGDNALRSTAAILAKFYDDFGGVSTVGGTANAITVTSSTTYTALATGMRVRFIAGSTNTAATTLNFDAIGAKAVRKISGGTDVALAGGEIQAGESYDIVYSATANAAAGAWMLSSAQGIITFGGSVTAPGLTPPGDPNSGLYPIGADNIGVAANGAKVLDISATGLGITGTVISSGAAKPSANDGAALGAAGTAWSDLFLAEGGVINWDSSDVTITQTGNALVVAGGAFAAEGSATNDSASAGQIGEYTSSTGSGVALTTNVSANVTSISLTAGDWDVRAFVNFLPAATTSVTALVGSISQTSATLDVNSGSAVVHRQAALVTGAVTTQLGAIGPVRISLNATTTIYFVANATFTVSTMAVSGLISARRVR